MHVVWRVRASFPTLFPTWLSSQGIQLALHKSTSTAYSFNLPTVTKLSRLLSSSRRYSMEPNGDLRYKRKNSPVKHFEHPSKLFKTDIPGPTHNDETSQEEGYEMDTDSENGRIPTLAPTTADSIEWQATIEKVVRNVVSIHFCQTCSFDTDPAVSSEATGFVIDAERGYIMTNRHVVGAGPFWGYCIFDNHEEASTNLSRFSLMVYSFYAVVRCLPSLPRPCP